LKRLVAGRLGSTRAGHLFVEPALPTLTSGAVSFHLGAAMIEVRLDESDRLDWALKTFKNKVMKSGILKDLRRKRHYVKPSEARQLKMAAARRRGRSARRSHG
jgi:small subunit ribosomal protein S21